MKELAETIAANFLLVPTLNATGERLIPTLNVLLPNGTLPNQLHEGVIAHHYEVNAACEAMIIASTNRTCGYVVEIKEPVCFSGILRGGEIRELKGQAP